MIGHALDSPFEIPDIPLRASSFVFDEVGLNQLSVQLAVEIDVRGLGFKEEGDRSNDALAFLIEAQHRETGEYYRYDQKIELSLLPRDAAQARAELVPGGARVHAAAGRATRRRSWCATSTPARSARWCTSSRCPPAGQLCASRARC